METLNIVCCPILTPTEIIHVSILAYMGSQHSHMLMLKVSWVDPVTQFMHDDVEQARM